MKILIAMLVGVGILLALTPQEEKGKDLFARRCSGCHSIDANKEGPRLHGVFGRKAGSVPGFTYSDGLQKSPVHWDAANLDKWLTDPEAMVPDTDMSFRVKDPAERQALIAYLKGL